MASQTDVQQLIQGLSQGSNNGNPNTAYNNAPGLPMADANGNWYLQNLPTAASINLQRGNAGGGIPNLFASLPPLNTSGVGGTNPAWPVTPTAPVVPPGTPTPTAGGGGGGAPLQVPPAVSLGGRGGDNTALPGNNFGGMPPGTSYGGGSTGTTNQYLQDIGGDINWQQLVDVAGDALGLPGNWYLDGTGKWDISNILTSLGSKVTGLPIGSVLSKIGAQVAKGGDVPLVPGWLEKLALDHYMDNAENRAENKAQNSAEAFDRKMMNDEIASLASSSGQKVDLGMLYQTIGVQGMAARGFNPTQINNASKMVPGGSVGVGLRAAGGFTPWGADAINGEAARSMFDGMKNITGSSKTYQSGGDIYGHKYAK